MEGDLFGRGAWCAWDATLKYLEHRRLWRIHNREGLTRFTSCQSRERNIEKQNFSPKRQEETHRTPVPHARWRISAPDPSVVTHTRGTDLKIKKNRKQSSVCTAPCEDDQTSSEIQCVPIGSVNVRLSRIVFQQKRQQ